MWRETNEVMVGGLRCRVVRRDGARMLVQPMSDGGRSLNVTRWIDSEQAATDAVAVEPPLLTPEEIRHLAMVLRQVFYEGDGPLAT